MNVQFIQLDNMLNLPAVSGMNISPGQGNQKGTFRHFLTQAVNATGLGKELPGMNNGQKINIQREKGAERLNLKNGSDALEHLKKRLLGNGEPLENLSTDKQSLDKLGKFLVKSGFGKAGVEELLEDLKAGAKDGKIRMSDLFSKISELKGQTLHSEEDLIPISNIPFVESLLSQLGLPPEEISKIVSNSTIEDQGISLTRLIDGLKNVASASPEYLINSMDEAGLKHALQMMNRMGLADKSDDKGPVTLETLIAALDELKAGKATDFTSGLKLSNAFDNLIEGFNVENTGSEKHQAFLNQIKAQLMAEGISQDGKVTDGNAKVLLQQFLVDAGYDEKQIANLIESLEQKDRGGFKVGELFARLQQLNNSKQTQPVNLEAFSENSSGPEGKNSDRLLMVKLNSRFVNGEAKNAFGENAGSKNPNAGTFGTSREMAMLKAMSGQRTQNGEEKNLRSGEAGRIESEVISFESHSKVFARSESVSEPKAPPRPLPNYVMNQVSRQLFLSMQKGESEISLKLNPPHLGRIQMNVDNSGGTLKVHIFAENQTAKEIILSHTVDLKHTFAEQGIRLEKVDVQISQDFNQTMANARENGQESGKGRKRNGLAMHGQDANQIAEVSEETETDDGRVHLVA
ncbi:MAG: flagellar hook-length control protein FliK [Desulfobacterales bacterium]|nr:flagellar hook-length control protein FliK [Desulfobacterales bacterium]